MDGWYEAEDVADSSFGHTVKGYSIYDNNTFDSGGSISGLNADIALTNLTVTLAAYIQRTGGERDFAIGISSDTPLINWKNQLELYRIVLSRDGNSLILNFAPAAEDSYTTSNLTDGGNGILFSDVGTHTWLQEDGFITMRIECLPTIATPPLRPRNFPYLTYYNALISKGEQGETGPQGDQGEQGIPGTAVAKGDVGPVGPEGPIGPAGPIGPQGIAGPQGSSGPKGDPGTAVAKGDPGAKGEMGSKGAMGVKGAPPDDVITYVTWDLDDVQLLANNNAGDAGWHNLQFDTRTKNLSNTANSVTEANDTITLQPGLWQVEASVRFTGVGSTGNQRANLASRIVNVADNSVISMPSETTYVRNFASVGDALSYVGHYVHTYHAEAETSLVIQTGYHSRQSTPGTLNSIAGSTVAVRRLDSIAGPKGEPAAEIPVGVSLEWGDLLGLTSFKELEDRSVLIHIQNAQREQMQDVRVQVRVGDATTGDVIANKTFAQLKSGASIRFNESITSAVTHSSSAADRTLHISVRKTATGTPLVASDDEVFPFNGATRVRTVKISELPSLTANRDINVYINKNGAVDAHFVDTVDTNYSIRGLDSGSLIIDDRGAADTGDFHLLVANYRVDSGVEVIDHVNDYRQGDYFRVFLDNIPADGADKDFRKRGLDDAREGGRRTLKYGLVFFMRTSHTVTSTGGSVDEWEYNE